MPRPSPLLVSIALILLTMAIAAGLAAYVTAEVERHQAALALCPPGSLLNYLGDWPKLAEGRLSAVITTNVPLSEFKFLVELTNRTTLLLADINNLELAAGAAGDVAATLPLRPADVRSVIVLSNCTNVRTEPRALR